MLEDGHPVVWVETYGNGIYGKRQILSLAKVIYRVGDQAEQPESIKDEDVRYQLVPICDTLWQHRSEIGPGQAFDNPFDYRRHTPSVSFDGDDFGADKANAPWGYDQETGQELSRGDWFLDPAKALPVQATFEGEFSTTYLFNPLLTDLGLLP